MRGVWLGLDVGKGFHRCVDGGFFVVVDSYAIACFAPVLRDGEEVGNSMGLILEARSPFFFTESDSWVFSPSCSALLSEQTEKAVRFCPVERARLHSKTLFDDDTIHIESST